MVGKADREFMALESASRLSAKKRVPATHRMPGCEQVWVSDNGRGFWRDLYVEPIQDKAGQVQGKKFVKADLAGSKRADSLVRARSRLLDFAASHSSDELLKTTLDGICTLTNSPFGVLRFLENNLEALVLHALSTRTVNIFYSTDGNGADFAGAEAEAYMDCLVEKRPVICNDYQALSHLNGMPDGRTVATRLAIVPFLRSERVIAILSIWNKPTNYTQEDVEIISFFADTGWEASIRRDAVKELQKVYGTNLEVLEPLTDDFFSVDREWRMTYVNDTGAKTLCSNKSDILGKVVWDSFPKTVELKFYSEFQRAAQTRAPVHFEEYYPEPLNNWYEIHAYPSPEGMSVYFRVISERKQAEEALRRRERDYRLLFETIFAGVAYQGLDGRFITMNPSAERILGLTREEFVGLTPEDVEHLTIREDGTPFPGLEHPGTVALRGGIEVSNVVMGWFNKREKDYRWININAVPLFREGEKKPYQVYAIFRDITEQKRLEEDLRKSRDELELRVVERTREIKEKSDNLEELNAALRVLLRQREEDRKELGESILTNVKNLILPYIDRLKKAPLSSNQKTWVEALELYLKEITSSFGRNFALQYASFTPSEIRVADLIKDGKSTKEIAEHLGISEKTVACHRDNIRDKLGLRGGRTNLRSYLLTLT
ncbi:MAG: PAS domain S-box protein [Syntrophobacteraceae bacterium]